MNDLSDTIQASMGNGAAIIERFGGIRPMASKINVPVTTVQGWKKRDAIPLSRLEQIRQAAREYNLDISDILKPSNENEKIQVHADTAAAPVRAERHMPENRTQSRADALPKSHNQSRFDTHMDTPMNTSVTPQFVGPVSGEVAREILRAERQAVAKSLIINCVLMAAGLAAAFALLWPGSPLSQSGREVTALEQKMAEMKIDIANVRRTVRTDTGAMGVVIPPEVQQKIEELQQKIDAATQTVPVSVSIPDLSSLEQRLARLEQGSVTSVAAAVTEAAAETASAAAGPVMAVAQSVSLQDVLNRFEALEKSPEGTAQLNRTWASLVAFLSNYQGDMQNKGSALQGAIAQNSELARVLGNTGPQQIEAAAMVFGMAQMRAMLGRENVPVENDLRVLQGLMGSSDPELTSALQNLMPLAGKSGIMTAQGLSHNLSAIAGSVVQAALSGDNVSIADMAKAQIGQVMQVEKHGAIITGNPAQAALTKAQTLLQAGDIAGAVSALNGLNGPAAAVLAPWMTNAQATLAAQNLKTALTRAIAARTGVINP